MLAARFLPCSALVLALVACATPPPADDPEAVAEFRENNDPLEPTNRALFAVHEVLDRGVLQPIAEAYRAVVPLPVRTGVRNALGNLRTPVILANDLLQGETERARVTLGRFMVNSVFGVAGIFDVARRWGVSGHSEDFGQTLAVWGVGEGPYLFIPLLGPSSIRDTAGFGVDLVTNPISYLGQGVIVEALGWSRIGLTAVDTREELIEAIDGVRQTSLDPYSTLRSAYRQRRQYEIRNASGGPRGPSTPAASPGFGQAVPQTPTGR